MAAGFRRVDHGDGARPGQPARHGRVLRFDRLDHQPGQPGQRQLFQQMPDGLRLASPGRTHDQGVPVQRRQRDRELANRPVQPVQDRPQADRGLAGHGLAPPGRAGSHLAGQVEVAGAGDPQPGHLLPGQTAQRGQNPGGGRERGLRAGHRVGRTLAQRRGQPDRQLAGDQPVRMMAQPRRAHQHRRQPGKLGTGGRTHHDPHLPQSRVPEGVEFGQPVGGTFGLEPGLFLVVAAQHIHLGAQSGDLRIERAGRFGGHQPAERPAQLREEGRLEQPWRPGLRTGHARLTGHSGPGEGGGGGGQRESRAGGAEHPDQAVPGREPAGRRRATARARRKQQRPAWPGG